MYEYNPMGLYKNFWTARGLYTKLFYCRFMHKRLPLGYLHRGKSRRFKKNLVCFCSQKGVIHEGLYTRGYTRGVIHERLMYLSEVYSLEKAGLPADFRVSFLKTGKALYRQCRNSQQRVDKIKKNPSGLLP